MRVDGIVQPVEIFTVLILNPSDGQQTIVPAAIPQHSLAEQAEYLALPAMLNIRIRPDMQLRADILCRFVQRAILLVIVKVVTDPITQVVVS
jgi:hypothetical protein